MTSTPNNSNNNAANGGGSASSSGAAAVAAAGDGNSNGAGSGGGSGARIIGSIEMEYNRFPNQSSWHHFYQEIRDKCEREANVKQFATSESEKPQNRCLNRYRDVNPYDHSRIILHRGGVDYINANLVKLARADRTYILTQGPLADTVGHFWLMVWEQNTKAILMLNKLMEKKQIKCNLYWPVCKGADNALKLDEVKLMVEYLRCEEYKNFSRRWFKLTDLETRQSREILQFHYTTWPDFGIPSSPVAFLQFLRQVRESGALDPNVGPAVVHCSAGIGRSGTFCLVDCCLVLIEKEGEHNVSVQNVLYELRRYRMGLIQTADQLFFSYQAIIEGIKLLNDPNFLVYNEAPIITSDDDDEQRAQLASQQSNQQHQQHCNLDETPPPLPPRTHSLLPAQCGGFSGGSITLNARSAQGKPLPKIPASESFNDELYAPDNISLQSVKNMDALNNRINTEKCGDSNTSSGSMPLSMSNRPLPPLPAQQQNSLDRVHESESQESDNYVDSDTETDTNSDTDMEDFIRGHDDENANSEGGISSTTTLQADANNGDGADNQSIDQQTGADRKKNIGNGVESFAGVSNTNINAGLNSHAGSSTENELKRRKRAERQSNIVQKVNEMKRKNTEAAAEKKTTNKRRSLVTYIAAGVFVGVICVYAYTKFA